MQGQAELRALEGRSRRYWNEDGIPELVMGLIWLLWGALMILETALPRGLQEPYTMLMPLVLVLSGFLAHGLIRRLKARLSDPLGGYVRHGPPSRAASLGAAGLAVAVAALVAYLAAGSRAASMETRLVPIVGVLAALAFLVGAVRQGAPWLLALAAVALLLGLAVGSLGLGLAGLNWLLIGLGLAASLLGLLRLRSFRRRWATSAAATGDASQ
mgnify:CR=1 FL=1